MSKKLTNKNIVVNALEQMLYEMIEDIIKHAEGRINNKQIAKAVQAIDAEAAISLAQALLAESVAMHIYISRLTEEPNFEAFEMKDVVQFRNISLDYMRKMLSEMITQPYEEQSYFPEIEGDKVMGETAITTTAATKATTKAATKDSTIKGAEG